MLTLKNPLGPWTFCPRFQTSVPTSVHYTCQFGPPTANGKETLEMGDGEVAPLPYSKGGTKFQVKVSLVGAGGGGRLGPTTATSWEGKSPTDCLCPPPPAV